MPKSRHRKKRKASLPEGVVKMTPDTHVVLLQQQRASARRFGAILGQADLIFFDPDAAEPRPLLKSGRGNRE